MNLILDSRPDREPAAEPPGPDASPSAPARGIAPALLISQVENTAPFLFEGAAHERGSPILGSALRAAGSGCDNEFSAIPPIARLQRLRGYVDAPCAPVLGHAEYFALCLSAHFATVATFVPTDVDIHIRFKLWPPGLPDETLTEMAAEVLAFRRWDERGVSTRVQAGADPALGWVSGHPGEWFSVAAAAYGALRVRLPETAAGIAAEIVEELRREAALYASLWQARRGIESLRAATLIAHNLGDLDRVLDLWGLTPERDPLAQAVRKLGHAEAAGVPRDGGDWRAWLAHAGRLNKAFMAEENHRHFALRAPRALRRSADLLLPVGPFFDAWGRHLARHPGLAPEEIGEICVALIDGWERLAQKPKVSPAKASSEGAAFKAPVGYARALAGVLDAFPGGASALESYMPARAARSLRGGVLRGLVTIPQSRFEDQWARAALAFKG